MSIDGRIAGPNGEMETWTVGLARMTTRYETKLMESIDTIL